VVAARPSSRLSASRTLRVRRRRDALDWSDVAGLLLAALLINGVGVYTTSVALARALEPKPLPKRERVVEFDLVPGPKGDRSGELRPAPPGTEVDDPAREARPRTATSPSKSKPGPARDKTEVADGRQDGSERVGEGVGEQPGVGDESLVVADDGELEGTGTVTGGQPDPLGRLGGSTSMLDQTFGRSVASDRMRDVDEDAKSILDSKRHLFGSFFNRLRDRVAENWQPQKAHSRADPNGTRYGDSQRMTVLMVRLDENGEILKIEVERKSGAPHHDEEAERAMRAAAPFPNLPDGLADEHGHVDFRFGFILDFNGGSRIFRYQN
jgi:TonB family protein